LDTPTKRDAARSSRAFRIAESQIEITMTEAVSIPNGVLETSVGVVAVGAVFGGIYMGHRIGDWLAEYNHEERNQIVSLQNSYRDKCWHLEKSEKCLSNRM
jgi:hypothetical protein